MLLCVRCANAEKPEAPAAIAPGTSAVKYNFPKTIDSLWLVAADTLLPDSTQLEALNNIAFTLRKNNPDSGIKVADQLIARAQSANNKKWEAYGYNARASNYFNKSAYDSALVNHERALKLRQEMGDRKTEAQSLGNMGLVYERKLDYVKAIDFHLQSLHIKEEMLDSLGMSNSYGNIGNIYMYMKQNDLALEYMKKCYNIKVKGTDTAGIALVNGNLGNIYLQSGDTVNALKEYAAALSLWEKIGDRKGQALTLNNAGSVYQGLHQNDKAHEMYAAALEIRRTLNDPTGIAASLGNLSMIYCEQGDFASAENCAKEALLIADTLHAPGLSVEALESMSRVAANRSDSRSELYYYREYVKVRDSIHAIDAEKDIARKEISFEFTKRAAADSVKNAEAQKVKDAEIAAQNLRLDQEQTQRYALYGGLALVLAFSGFAWNRFRVTRRQKGIIELQKSEVESAKHIIEEKQKEIIDSINYAKRLQQAILPPEEQFAKLGRDRFLIYKPKDIVAGDFYFLEQVGDDLFVAAADSTGHGVPGAMVSVVCSNALLRAVRELKITEPGKILDKATELILETFSRSNMDVKDGMDISLCRINTRTGSVSWAGANNSLWLMRDGECISFEANKQPVGMYDHRVDFQTHTVEVKSGDMLYLFTDGFADQFGGEKGKKYKTANFRKLLQGVAMRTCEEQRVEIERAFSEWKMNLEQVDDVCVVGVRM